MRVRKTQRQAGLTLIETLLAIAILAIVAVSGISLLRQHAQQQRVSHTAQAVDQVLQAALSYNADNAGDWPESHDAADCASTMPASSDFVEHYLPGQSAKSGLGGQVCWGSVPFAPDQPGRLFWAAVALPQHQPGLAAALAARLPNAVMVSEPSLREGSTCQPGQVCYLHTEIAAPASTAMSITQGAAVVAAGVCQAQDGQLDQGYHSTCKRLPPYPSDAPYDPNASYDGTHYEVTFKGCPKGQVPQLMTSMSAAHYPRLPTDDYRTFGFRIMDLGVAAEKKGVANPCDAMPDAQGNSHCYIHAFMTDILNVPNEHNPKEAKRVYVDLTNFQNKEKKWKSAGAVYARYNVLCVIPKQPLRTALDNED